MSVTAPATPEMDAETPVAPVESAEPKTLDSVLDEVDTELAAERAPSVGQDRGDGRDSTGKWVKRNADGSPAPEPPAAAAPTPTPPEGAPEPAPSLASGFKYRAVGATHEFQGATIDEKGGVYIAPESVGAFRAALNAKHLAEGEYVPLIEQHKAKIADLEARVQERSAAEAKADALTTALQQALTNEDEVAALEAFYNLRTTLPSLMAKAEADYWRQKASAPRTESPYKEEPKAEAPAAPSLPTPDVAWQATTEYLERCKIELPEFRDVTPEDWKQLEAQLQRTPYAFLRRATPEDITAGIASEGEILYDTDALVAHVQAETSKARTARETAKTQTKLAADNARRTTPQVTAPPSAGGTKAPAKQPARITSKDDLDAYWDSPEA